VVSSSPSPLSLLHSWSSLGLSATFFLAASAQAYSAAAFLILSWKFQVVTSDLLLVMFLISITLLWVILIFLNLYASSID
jgi:hypothetical protein